MNWPETETTPAPTTPLQEMETAENRIKAKATEAFNTGEDYIRERPITTVLTALLLGAVVGVLLRQLSRHDDEPVYRKRLGEARHWMEDAVDNVREQLHEVPERGSRRFNAARDWMAHAYEDARERAHEVPDRGARGFRAAKDWFSHAYDDVRDRAHDVKDRIHLPRFRREPTFLEKAEAALGRLRFW